MLPVLLVSVTPFVGKNVVALGIAEKFRRGESPSGTSSRSARWLSRSEAVSSMRTLSSSAKCCNFPSRWKPFARWS